MANKYLDQAGTQLLIDTLKSNKGSASPAITMVECNADDVIEIGKEDAPVLICDTPDNAIPDGGIVAVQFSRSIEGGDLFGDAGFMVETSAGFSCTQKPVLLRIGSQEYPVWYHGRIGGSQNDVVVGGGSGAKVKYYTLQPMNVQYPYDAEAQKTWDHVWMWVSQEKDKDTKYNFSEFIVNFSSPADGFIDDNNKMYNNNERPFYFDPNKMWVKADKSWINIIKAWAAGRTVIAIVDDYNVRLPLSQIYFDDGVKENGYAGNGHIVFGGAAENRSISISREYNNIGDGATIPNWGSHVQPKNSDPFPMWKLYITTLAKDDDVTALQNNVTTLQNNVAAIQNIPLTTVQGWFE